MRASRGIFWIQKKKENAKVHDNSAWYEKWLWILWRKNEQNISTPMINELRQIPIDLSKMKSFEEMKSFTEQFFFSRLLDSYYFFNFFRWLSRRRRGTMPKLWCVQKKFSQLFDCNCNKWAILYCMQKHHFYSSVNSHQSNQTEVKHAKWERIKLLLKKNKTKIGDADNSRSFRTAGAQTWNEFT